MRRDAKFAKFTAAQSAILTTVLYSDIFSFPLTKGELWKFLISKEKVSKEDFETGLEHVKKYFVSENGYYCFKSNKKIIAQRIENLSEIKKKLQRAHFVSRKLSGIPSILFIGITGGLAVGNAKENDDIDLVIIAKKNTLFTTRLVVLFILQMLGIRRSRNQKNTANMICTNLLFDESVLDWPQNNQDVYIAREIVQIMPLFEREKMYSRFLKANDWIKDYLPNIQLMSSLQKQGSKSIYGDSRLHRNDKGVNIILNLFMNSFFEWIFCNLQMSWMKRHQTRETVTKHLLALHPKDYRTKIMQQLRLKSQQFGLLTKF